MECVSARARWLLPLLAAALVAGCTATDDPEPSDSTAGETAEPSEPTAQPTEPATKSPADKLGLATGWGPTQAELDTAARVAGNLSLPDLAGQVIVASWSGTEAPTAMVDDLHLGGVIWFTENVTSTGQVKAGNQALVDAADRDYPLFLSVDQEGGIVERVQGDATRFPTFMSAGAADDTGLTEDAARASAAELRGLGFTVDFAPDADVTAGPQDPTIGSRSAGSDPRLVADQSIAAAEGYLAGGVVPVIKHFPGHGSVTADSHTTLPVQGKTMAQLRRTDLVPFRAAIEAGLPSIMVGHLDVTAVDPGTPSSVSPKVIDGLLRQRLGFDGLVMSDSLQMAGVADSRTAAQSSVEGLEAGMDVLLMPPDPRAARDGIVAAVKAGDLDRRRVEQAAARQIAMLLHTEATDGAPVGSGAQASQALSAGAVTLVAGACSGRLVGDSVTPTGDPDAVAAFTAAARAAGLGVGGGDTVAFTGYAGSGVSGDVAVSVDTPYALAASTAPTKIALYGDSPGAMAALVDVLTGEARAPGRLPVPVDGLPRTAC